MKNVNLEQMAELEALLIKLETDLEVQELKNAAKIKAIKEYIEEIKEENRK